MDGELCFCLIVFTHTLVFESLFFACQGDSGTFGNKNEFAVNIMGTWKMTLDTIFFPRRNVLRLIILHYNGSGFPDFGGCQNNRPREVLYSPWSFIESICNTLSVAHTLLSTAHVPAFWNYSEGASAELVEANRIFHYFWEHDQKKLGSSFLSSAFSCVFNSM